MIKGIGTLLSLLAATAQREGAAPRFWAVVLAADGENALLAVRNEKLPVKLEVPVHLGEKLLLEEGTLAEGRLQCRILKRLAPQEQGTLRSEPLQIYLAPDPGQSFPYLLTVEEEGCPEGDHQVQRIWHFTLFTENLGIVVLAVRKSNMLYRAVMLLESAAALEKLAGLPGRFSSEEQGIILEGVRVMNAGERTRFCKAGGTLNSTR